MHHRKGAGRVRARALGRFHGESEIDVNSAEYRHLLYHATDLPAWRNDIDILLFWILFGLLLWGAVMAARGRLFCTFPRMGDNATFSPMGLDVG